MTGGAEAQSGTGGSDLLARFNDLPPNIAVGELLSCCASATWAAQVSAGRPYASAEACLRRSDAAVATLSPADLGEALSGHPRIGEPAAGPANRQPTGGSTADSSARSAAWSRREQSGVRAADAATMRSLAELNREYERRFDHIYLVCATGRSAGELADLLRERLGNDGAAEWLVVRSELQQINRIRLRELLGGTG